MAKIDSEKERQRLAALYAGVEEGELEEIASEPESLSDVALEALRSEMLRRRMEPPPKRTQAVATAAKKPEPPKPVMIRRFRDLPDASIAKSMLDSAGIESFLVDDNLIGLHWFYSNAVGGIKLLVRQEDADTANKLLDQNVPANFNVEGVGEFEQPRCPRCQSSDVAFDGLDKHITYGLLFFSLPIPMANKGWKCHACGHTWKDDGNPQTSVPGHAQPH